MSDSIFDVAVPNEDLTKPAFEVLPVGAYRATLQPGAEKVGNDSGWEAVRLPFANFVDTAGKTHARNVRAQFTTKHATNTQTVQIGTAALIGAAAAFGLTQTVDVEGKPAQKLVAKDMDELVAQFNSVAGSEASVYVKVQKRKRDGKVVTKDNGEPVLDNEISRVSKVA